MNIFVCMQRKVTESHLLLFLFLDELQSYCNIEDSETSNLLGDLQHLDSHETPQVSQPCQPEERRHHQRVTIPERGGEIYKATLVSLLNELSHDRLNILS